MHAHLPGNVAQHNVTIFQLNPERCIGKVLENLSLHFNDIFFRHEIYILSEPAVQHHP